MQPADTLVTSERPATIRSAEDAIIILHQIPWETFEALVEAKGDSGNPRYAYLDGELEIMSPSVGHELVKKTLARLIEGQVEVPGIYTPVEIVQEFEAAISVELDFLQEARAAARFRANHVGIEGVTIPYVHKEFCTRRLLVMERIHGTKLNAVAGGSEAGRAAMRKFIFRADTVPIRV